MKDPLKIEILVSEIEKTKSLIAKIENFYNDFKQTEFERLGKTTSSAIILAEVFENYYTSLETLFIKISQFFENNLLERKWHKDLLDKMMLAIPNVRKAMLSDKSHNLLLEFLRFRHFKRYYVEFEYDWDKLEFLEKKFFSLQKVIHRDLKSYERFLKDLKNS